MKKILFLALLSFFLIHTSIRVSAANGGKNPRRPVECGRLFGKEPLTPAKGEWMSFRAEDVARLEELLENTTINEVEKHYFFRFLSHIPEEAQDEVDQPAVDLFVSSLEKGKVPRIAIFYELGRIREIRGFSASLDLDTGAALSEALTEKLKGLQVDSDDPFFKMAQQARRRAEIEVKMSKGEELSRIDLRFLYGIEYPLHDGFNYFGAVDYEGLIKMKVYFSRRSLGYGRDLRFAELRSARDVRADLALIFGVDKSVVTTDSNLALNGKAKVFYGDLHSEMLSPGAILPDYVIGNLSIANSELRGVRLPKAVFGSLYVPDLIATDDVVYPELVYDVEYAKLESARSTVFPLKVENRIIFRKLAHFDEVIWPKDVGDFCVNAGVLRELIPVIAKMRVRNQLTVLWYRDYREDLKLEDVILPEIEGGRYAVMPARLINVTFPVQAKSVYVNARVLRRVVFPRVVDELKAPMAEIINSVTFPQITGPTQIGIIHPQRIRRIHYTGPLSSVQGTYEGPAALLPNRKSRSR